MYVSKIIINIITLYSERKTINIYRTKNDDSYHKGREGGGRRVMIGIIISENDDNEVRNFLYSAFWLYHFIFMFASLNVSAIFPQIVNGNVKHDICVI